MNGGTLVAAKCAISNARYLHADTCHSTCDRTWTCPACRAMGLHLAPPDDPLYLRTHQGAPRPSSSTPPTHVHIELPPGFEGCTCSLAPLASITAGFENAGLSFQNARSAELLQRLMPNFYPLPNFPTQLSCPTLL